jgi:hypothetical protein
MKRINLVLASSLLGIIAAVGPAQAAPPEVRSSGRTSVTSTRNASVDRNVHVEVDRRGAHQGGGCCYQAVAATPAPTATTAAARAATVGSVVTALPPTCKTVVLDELAYQQCGETYYQPRMSGTSTTYVVVSPPR